jgi:hypothetical protein
MVQFRYTALAVIAASVVAPALANNVGYDNSVDAREYNDLVDFLERDFQVDAREFDGEVFRRDPLFGFIKKWWNNRKANKAAAAAGGDQGMEAREYDEELMTREFDEYFRRELEDLMERDPLFGINHIKKWFGKKTQPAQEQQQYAERDFEEDFEARDFEEEQFEAREFEEAEFEAREFDEELDAREFDEELDAREYELEERDPFLGFNHIKKWFSGKKAQPQPAADQFAERDLEELDARDLEELNDLLEREPFLGFNHVKKWLSRKKGAAAQAGADQYADQQQARDFEEDIEAREPEYEEVLERYFDDLYERELNDELEVVEREITDERELAEREEEETSIFQREDIDEMFTRGFDLKAWWNNLWHPKKKQDNQKKQDKKATSTSAAAPAATSAAAAEPAAEASTEEKEAREFEIDELD